MSLLIFDFAPLRETDTLIDFLTSRNVRGAGYLRIDYKTTTNDCKIEIFFEMNVCKDQNLLLIYIFRNFEGEIK